ncbi:translocator protein-like [Physella acuta]|uniref:translocator protein-like n=1 Tax=Physella acuta TaxID=109671 RepID=UPI0027DC6E38|nr:translocator protein-like [Physella acuta]XP_059152398.1 translocator protein-like [Physella acuta]XP_059152399.1 translocator protein-like [Physella acuta]
MSDYIAPAVAMLIPNVGGFVGGLAVKGNIKTWFDHLKLPSWRPPTWLFGPVWTTLFCCMGYASYLVWRDGGGFGGDAALPLTAYCTQLAINWVWAPIFFGTRNLKWSMTTAVCLWTSIAGTIYLFYGINETASYLMLPYLGWVSFGTALTYKLWSDNPDPKKE